MKSIILAFLASFLVCTNIFAQGAFRQVSSEKMTVTEAQIGRLQKQATVGTASGTTLTFAANRIDLVVIPGPEDDMLSYRIQGMRNPTIITPSHATLTVWFANTDDDMRHDIRFGYITGDFAIDPGVEATAGTDRLGPHTDEKTPMQAEKIVIASNKDGAYKYYCSVRGHAKGGMWGNILVGVKPGPDTQTPAKPSGNMDNMPGMNMPKPTATPTPPPGDMSGMPGMDQGKSASMPGMKQGMSMSSVTNIGDPMTRESSGTAWAPDSSPMYARIMSNSDGSMWMFMGTAFVRYTDIGSSRDVSVAGKGDRNRVDAPTMLMAMYSHPIGESSQFGFRTMVSLDPIIERGYGYPLLYQSGEQFGGQPLHDRQHPHDLISELAITFSHRFGSNRSFFLYAGYPGEPALGPTMYLHRTSGMNVPDAPVGHHWEDATHIAFGVVTAGFSFGRAKIEASAFNGTEPDENRWNFDKPRLSSFSGRLSLNPTKNWSLQVSHGYIRDPERFEPEVRVLRRTTASTTYNKKLGEARNWASTLVWGQNYANRKRTNALLFESNYGFYKNAVFGRFETVQKSGLDLVLTPQLERSVFMVAALSAGYIRDLVSEKGVDVGLGGVLTADFNPTSLTPFYGGTSHAGWQLFMRFRPSRTGH